MYYRGANAALLLYDITNASTFEDIRGWLEGVCPLKSQLPSYLTRKPYFRVEEELPTRVDNIHRWLQGRSASPSPGFF